VAEARGLVSLQGSERTVERSSGRSGLSVALCVAEERWRRGEAAKRMKERGMPPRRAIASGVTVLTSYFVVRLVACASINQASDPSVSREQWRRRLDQRYHHIFDDHQNRHQRQHRHQRRTLDQRYHHIFNDHRNRHRHQPNHNNNHNRRKRKRSAPHYLHIS